MLIHPGSEEKRRDEGWLERQRARGRSDDQEEEWREEEGAAENHCGRERREKKTQNAPWWLLLPSSLVKTVRNGGSMISVVLEN